MAALLGISGSLRAGSLNRALLAAVGETLPAGSTLAMWGALDLPIFNSDLGEPAAVAELKAAIAQADGVVFAVPEYNYSIPGGLKNALDWISRPPPLSPLRGKPVALVGAASGMSGTIRAQTHMRQILLFSDAQCLGQPEVLIPRAQDRFDATGRLTDESTRTLLARFGEAFVGFVARFARVSR
ncbi:MAG: NAD(P)H-dependent oxidoreductase [Deltaproteobacteria bacterium]|nr:NAD(P)H-dependent oxidoreductase [Deltaproteobacteria bacterium]MDQ3296455.1 NAD(P)H-dependent oxidoreductase [Myxococcota bacterium]